MEAEVVRMMQMPSLRNTAYPAEQSIVQFSGMNNRYPVTAGTIRDADGLSGAQMPSLSALPAQTEIRTYDNPVRMYPYSGGVLCITQDGIFLNDIKLTLPHGMEQQLRATEADEYLIAGINTQIVVYPLKISISVTDKKIYSLDTDCELGTNLVTDGTEPNWTLHLNEWVESEGQYFDLIRVQKSKLLRVVWVRFHSKDGTIKMLPMRSSEQVYKVNDTVDICDEFGTVLVQSATIRYMTDTEVGFYANSLKAALEYYNGKLMFKRTAPSLTTLCEGDNRLWGTEGNTIYACALGDPFNWHRYDGLSDDSYAVSVATDGDFTAAAHYGTHICLFKENTIHKVYGSKPSNYQVVTVTAPGVKTGCARSVATVGAVLYFCGRDGIYAYDGDAPECLSANIDDTTIPFAIGTAQHYVAYTGERLLAFDTVRKLWLPVSHDWLCDMVYAGGETFLLHPNGMLTRRDEHIDYTKTCDWWVQLEDIDDTTPAQKRYQKLLVQAVIQRNAWLRIDIRMDGGRWREVSATEGTRGAMLSLPVYPNRCNSLGIRFRCHGDVTIHSITRCYTSYSERR